MMTLDRTPSEPQLQDTGAPEPASDRNALEPADRGDTAVAPHGDSGRGELDREGLVRRAAYAVAERRGFAPGFELDDWLEAGRQIDGETAQGSPQPGQTVPAGSPDDHREGNA